MKCNISDHSLSELLGRFHRITSTNGIDKAMEMHQLNIVVGPGDSDFVALATGSGKLLKYESRIKAILISITGYPIASVPLGYIEYSGRPYGLQLIAKAAQEAILIRAMSAWERMMPTRRAPDLSWTER